MPFCFPRPAGSALVLALLVAASALPVRAQVVIEERVTPLTVSALDAANSVAAPSTFTPTVSGTLRLRYESLNEGRFYAYSYVDLTTHALNVTFDDGSGATSLSDLLDGRFGFRRRLVGSFGFRGYYWDTYWAQTRPSWVYTYTKRTEGIDEYEAEPTFDLGEVEAGVPFTLGIDYAEPDGGTHPLTLTELVVQDTAYALKGRYYAGGSPIGTPSRQITVTIEVVRPSGRVLVGGSTCSTGPVGFAASASPEGGTCSTRPPAPTDTLLVTQSSAVTLEVEAEADDPVDLNVDTPLGRLVQIADSDTTDVEGSIPFAALEEAPVFFLADGEWPDSTTAVPIEVTVGGKSLEGASVLVLAPELWALYPNDARIPTASVDLNGSVLMVSREVTNQALPPSTPFSSGLPSVDHGTFRPQLARVPASAKVAFEAFVTRGGSAVPQSSTGQEGVDLTPVASLDSSVAGVLPDLGPTHRARRLVRLVSNARPPEVQGPAPAGLYDDEVQGFQTIRVEIGDRVHLVALESGAHRDTVSFDVALPPGSPELNSSRRLDINFITPSGLSTSSNPAEAVRRLGEDWAQAAIDPGLVGQQAPTPVTRNALVFSAPGDTVAVDGGVRVAAIRAAGDTVRVDISVAAGDSIAVAARRIATELRAHFPNVRTTLHSDFSLPTPTSSTYSVRTMEWIVVIEPGANAVTRVLSATDTTGIATSNPFIDYNVVDVPDQFTHLEIIGLNHKDGSDRSVDVIALPNGALARAYARAGGYGASWSYYQPGSRATVFIESDGVNGDDSSLPTTFGHEVGHVLFNVDFPGSTGGHVTGPANKHIIMWVGTGTPAPWLYLTQEDPDTRKRITEPMHRDARSDADGGSENPLLY